LVGASNNDPVQASTYFNPAVVKQVSFEFLLNVAKVLSLFERTFIHVKYSDNSSVCNRNCHRLRSNLNIAVIKLHNIHGFQKNQAPLYPLFCAITQRTVERFACVLSEFQL